MKLDISSILQGCHFNVGNLTWKIILNPPCHTYTSAKRFQLHSYQQRITFQFGKPVCLSKSIVLWKLTKIQNFQRGCHFSIRPLNPRSILALNSKSGLDEFSRFVFSTSSEFEKSRKVLKFGHLIKRATGSSEQLLNALILICTTEKDDADADQMFEKYSNQEHWVHLYKSDEFYETLTRLLCWLTRRPLAVC